MKITAGEIRYYLKNPEYIQELRERILQLRKEIAAVEEQYEDLMKDIYETVQVGVNYEKNSSTSGKKRDLSDILEMTRKMLELQQKELYEQYRSLLEELDKLHRYHLVMGTLPQVKREILSVIDEKNEKWDYAAVDLELSKSQVSKLRRAAISDVECLFNSGLSNQQIASQQNPAIYERKKQVRKPSGEMPGQVTWEDFVKEGGK